MYLVISDIQSLSVPTSPPPAHVADMWPASVDLGFLLFCCDTMLAPSQDYMVVVVVAAAAVLLL